jgi:hypothetical protein
MSQQNLVTPSNIGNPRDSVKNGSEPGFEAVLCDDMWLLGDFGCSHGETRFDGPEGAS